MNEIATIIFTGLCLFAPAPGGNPFHFTAYLFSHDKQTAAPPYNSIDSHEAYVRVAVDVLLQETKRSYVPSTQRKYALFYLKPAERITFKGIQDTDLTAPAKGFPPDEGAFSMIPAFTEICDEKDCGTMIPSHGPRVDIDRGVLFTRTDHATRTDWRFCTGDGKECSSKTISKNDVLPRAAALHVHGDGSSLQICSGKCGSKDSIWVRKGATVIIGSGIRSEVENDDPPKHSMKQRETDRHFELYYTTRSNAPQTKHYLPIDSKKTYPEGSNCPPLRY